MTNFNNDMETRLLKIEQAIRDFQFARDTAKNNGNVHRVNELNRAIDIKIAQHDEILNEVEFGIKPALI